MASAQTMCVECGDQEAALNCTNCQEPFCSPCWQQQHRRGKRTEHHTTMLLGEMMPQPTGAEAQAGQIAVSTAVPSNGAQAQAQAANGGEKPEQRIDTTAEAADDGADAGSADDPDVAAFARVPLRLSQAERGLLDVLQGALHVSEYTDVVDTIRYWGKSERILEQLQELFDQLTGLMSCQNFKVGTRLAMRDYAENEQFFRSIFEIGRRYKIMNPEKMRSTYGKLMYILQDAIDRTIARDVGFDVVAPIRTVKDLLQGAPKGMGMLRDPMFAVAVQALDHMSGAELQAAAAKKEEARRHLIATFAGAELSEEDVMRVVYSVADAKAFEATATYPVRRMRYYLEKYFDRDSPSAKHGNLSIRWGEGGSKLDHDHATQYRFVYQSLMLWERVMKNMFSLWACADNDLLNPRSSYRLWNTGQGLNRVQSCANVSHAMHAILSSVHADVRRWVGLSVVHLGDRDVPNALMFIDKYTQVPRILGPIVETIDHLEELAQDPKAKTYIDKVFGGVELLRMEILNSYFRHGFDGSGSDGGSCVDGRLTSTWNWCSKIEKKRFYHIFMMAGFSGFDGDWRSD